LPRPWMRPAYGIRGWPANSPRPKENCSPG
jgi:hypothetical protein